jgi:hypothetical protein
LYDATNSTKYWDFTLDEIGKFDLPTMIDFALKTNGVYDKIGYVGFSQGTLDYIVGASFLPEYFKNKVSVFVAWGPAFGASSGSDKQFYGDLLEQRDSGLDPVSDFSRKGQIIAAISYFYP